MITLSQTNSVATRLHIFTSESASCSSMFTEIKVRSYQNGSSSMGRIKICKRADGTVILEAGEHRFVQRPLHHPERNLFSAAVNKERITVIRFLQKLFAW